MKCIILSDILRDDVGDTAPDVELVRVVLHVREVFRDAQRVDLRAVVAEWVDYAED